VEACGDGSNVLKHGTIGEALTGHGGEQSEREGEVESEGEQRGVRVSEAPAST
jgi:hypothetical protein